jgi:hypothetical protein
MKEIYEIWWGSWTRTETATQFSILCTIVNIIAQQRISLYTLAHTTAIILIKMLFYECIFKYNVIKLLNATGRWHDHTLITFLSTIPKHKGFC